jgi:hypothetical protein
MPKQKTPEISCDNCRKFLPRSIDDGFCLVKKQFQDRFRVDYECFSPVCERCKNFDNPEGSVNCSYFEECLSFEMTPFPVRKE